VSLTHHWGQALLVHFLEQVSRWRLTPIV